ncbi:MULTISPECIES: hypothetical protein [Rhizobium]|uniref:hypothetical protein n=1 Tax=Rhizobium TaxID=379 RepID=UPI00103B2A69|nr:hypothetical protein [Rhizobium leguminosarum]TBZ99371.1 hypothetical protein E0H57_28190 [Rhizobium leguminosarum bv. viciae]UFW76717.1 hypothetical protein RlegSU303_15770 [Rhizobium leguminosarum bv. viciae]
MPQDTINVDGWLELFKDTQLTVWFVEQPQAKLQGQWVGHHIYDSIEAAVKAVSDDAGNHFGYDMFVHAPGGDKHVSQRELAALIGIYRREETSRQ